MTPFRFLLVPFLVLCGCRGQGSETGQAAARTAADSLATGSGEGLGAPENGVEFEAPRLIPGMLAMLRVVTDSGGRVGEGTATGYKQAAGNLVDAMLSDLNRTGVGDDGSVRAMGDSLADMLGGGTGVPDASPAEVQRSAALMRRLIETYQQRMRSVQS